MAGGQEGLPVQVEEVVKRRTALYTDAKEEAELLYV